MIHERGVAVDQVGDVVTFYAGDLEAEQTEYNNA